MKRLLLIILAIIVIIPLALGAWLMLFFDANDYRDEISTGFKEATGRDITIAGDLNTSFFPWIGIETGEIEVSNSPGFGETPLAGIEGMKIRLKLMPLLSGSVEMETLVLDGVQANLVTLENGKSNWNPEGAATAGTADKSIAVKAGDNTSSEKSAGDDRNKSTQEKAKAAPVTLAIGGVEMTNASITWDDRRGGTKVELTKMNLETGAISFDEAISVKFTTDFSMNGDEMKGLMKVSTLVSLDQNMQKIDLSQLELDIDATGTSLEGGKLVTTLKSDINVDRDSQMIASKGIAFTMKLSGDAAPVNPMAVTLNSPLSIDLDSMVVDLPTMTYSIPGSTGTGSLNLSNLDNPMPTVKLKIETDTFDATPWMGGGATPSPIGRWGIEESNPLRPFILSLVSIHSASAAGNPGTSTEQLDIPVETIRQLDVDASLNIGTFIMEGLQATEVTAELKAMNGIVRIEPMSAKLFGGSSTGFVELDARTDTPKFHLNENLDNVQIAEVMKYSMGKDSKEWITGVADMQADIRTRGNDTAAITKGLNGTVDAKVKDGAFEGFSVRKLLQQANALLKGESYVDDGSPDRTKILELGTKTKLVNGVAVTDNIKVLTPLADLTGSGSANLNTEQLDYRLKLALSSGISEIDKAEFKKLEGKALPLKVTGNFSDPKFKIDASKAAKQEVKQKTEKKLRKKYGKKYGKELDMLFGK